jgi:hypothetical protein
MIGDGRVVQAILAGIMKRRESPSAKKRNVSAQWAVHLKQYSKINKM